MPSSQENRYSYFSNCENDFIHCRFDFSSYIFTFVILQLAISWIEGAYSNLTAQTFCSICTSTLSCYAWSSYSETDESYVEPGSAWLVLLHTRDLLRSIAQTIFNLNPWLLSRKNLLRSSAVFLYSCFFTAIARSSLFVNQATATINLRNAHSFTFSYLCQPSVRIHVRTVWCKTEFHL